MPTPLPPYSAGTISITTGTATLIGNGTAWSSMVKTHDPVHLAVADAAPVFVGYVLSVDGDDAITLAADWNGDTIAAGDYFIGRGIGWLAGAEPTAIFLQLMTALAGQGLISSGTAAPDPAAGRENDFHYDHVNLMLYQRRAGSWEEVALADFPQTIGADIASSATLNLDNATGGMVTVTGDTTITAVTLAAGRLQWARFDDDLTIQVGASLIGNGGGADVAAKAGDFALFRGYAGGVVRFFLLPLSGKTVAPLTAANISDATARGREILKGADGAPLRRVMTADAAGANVNTAQPWFPSLGAADVDGGTTYEFEGHLHLSRSAGSTSHTTSLLFGGTATIASIDYLALCKEGDANDLQDVSGVRGVAATAVQVKAASTSTTEQILIFVKGVVRFSDAGTFIPQFQYSAAPGQAPQVKRNSFFKMTPIGADDVASVGAWS